jgi:hypothetical protein
MADQPNPFEGLNADERREFWNDILKGMAGHRPTTPQDEEALQRLWPKGEIGFPGRASLFAIRHGWRGGTPAQACTFIEQNRLVDALADFHAGTGVQIDLSKLPRDENGNIIATEW